VAPSLFDELILVVEDRVKWVLDYLGCSDDLSGAHDLEGFGAYDSDDLWLPVTG
jgi:hypothetical protein